MTDPSGPGNPSTPSGGSQGWAEWSAQRVEDVPIAVGQTLRGRFVLEEVIGGGGMGLVFRARDLRRDEAQDRHPHVAIKVLAGEFRRHPDALKALQREARKAQRLAHPNVGSVYDFDRDGAHVYLVMELLEGEPLNQTIKAHPDGSLGRQRAFDLVEGAALALAHAHSRGIVHSDFKPSNVFLTRGDEVKIIDFGIARAARSGAAATAADVSQTVFDAAKLGAATLAYASPEQLLSVSEPDPRDDVYSLAVVTFELLTGRHPFERRSALEAQLLELRVPEVPGLTAEQNAALARGLAFRRESRPPTVNDFVVGLGLPPVSRSLAAAPAASGGAPTVMSVGKVVRSGTGRLRWVVAALLLLALSGGAWFVYSAAEQRAAQSAQRAIEEQTRRDAQAALEKERQARRQAELDQRAAEQRIAEERIARERAEQEQLRAEVTADRERAARERAEAERAAAARLAKRAEATSGKATASPGAAVPVKPKAGTVYRWKDETGAVRYGTEVPAAYLGSAVPLLPGE